MTTITGGCLCGQVRYEAGSDMIIAYRCHCRDCQRSSGCGHMALFALPADNVSVTGELKFYRRISDDGNGVNLGFCPNCGSNILGKPELTPDLVAITAGSLDDPTLYKPVMDIFTESAPDWETLAAETMKFPRMFEDKSEAT